MSNPDLDSDDRRTKAVIAFLRALIIMGASYLLILMWVATKSSIGIKRSIKKLFTAFIKLDICRYTAYIMPRSNGNESTRHDKAVTDHSGAGRGKLD
jgi:hypothetical protein